MSRVANNPISIPSGVEAKIADAIILVKGNKGSLTFVINPLVVVTIVDSVIQCAPANEGSEANLQAGTARAVINNMVYGVSTGFERKLTLIGVGYRAQLQGKTLALSLGFSHPIEYKAQEGITIEVPAQTEVVIKGADKQKVGQVAAEIRAYRPPEPYKGKGVRYANEKVLIKEAKKK